jgi:hypothetical protein
MIVLFIDLIAWLIVWRVVVNWDINLEQLTSSTLARERVNLICDCESIIWAGHVACMGEMKNGYGILFRKPEDKRVLGKSRRRWENTVS